jgi:hypothetical protein
MRNPNASHLRLTIRAAWILLLAAGCGSHAHATAPSPVRVPMYAGMQGHTAVSPATAGSIARSVRLVVGTVRQLRTLAPVLVHAHPGILVEVYVNAMFAHPDDTSYPHDWYLRDGSGTVVRSRSRGNLLMNPSSTTAFHGVHGWASWVARECRAALSEVTQADGCFLDMTGPAPVRPAYDARGATPVDPSTGQPFRESSYLERTAALSRLVERVTGRPVISNGIESGVHWVRGTRALLAGAHGFEIEHWLGLNQRQARSLDGWRSNVAVVMALARLHRRTLVDVHTVPGQTSRSLEFALASFLLSAGPGQFLQIGPPGHSVPSWDLPSPLYGVALGSPTETAADPDGYRQGALFMRRFQRGLVVVNPTDQAQPFTPPAGYAPAPGAPPASAVIAPLTGVILVRR